MKSISTSIDRALDELEKRRSRAATSLETARDDLTHAFAVVAAKVARSADRLADAVSASEVRVVSPPNLAQLVQSLDREGPAALSRRELRILVGTAGRLDARQLAGVLDHAPALVFHAARTCFAYWPDYVREPWGSAYQTVVSSRLDLAAAQLLRVRSLTATRALARSVPGLETDLVLQLDPEAIERAYEQMKALGVRDSWLLSSSVLNAWLLKRLQRGLSLDEAARCILQHERLGALLLPSPKSSTTGPAVRTNVATQAQTVATLLAAAYSDLPLLTQSTLTSLTDYLLRSTFDDPRLPLRSEGWNRVNQLYEAGFRRMLSALCEQDLEVFFKHAMKEPDRHQFWLQYLHDIERTGCVLDRTVRKGLDAKLERRPELHGALERAYTFSSGSDVQAFYLVFPSIVVVEFSKSGNAAYVYPRPFFEKRIEPAIRKHAIGDASKLKDQAACRHRILHHVGIWQNDAAAWLASEGLHARAPRR